MEHQRPKIGLALGSGGARGFVHIGVLKVLVNAGIPIDFLAGTSIGAWVATHYALYRDLTALEGHTIGHKREKLGALLEPTLRGGLIRGRKVERLLYDWLGNHRFEDLSIPTTVVATDFFSADEVDINTGAIVPAVRASMAIPLMFQPVEFNGRVLVDGGISNPLPDDIVRRMGADIVIAVNIDARPQRSRILPANKIRLLDVANQSYQIMRYNLAKYSATSADIVIEPHVDPSSYQVWKSYFTQPSISHLVEEGERATHILLPRIQALIATSKTR